MHVRVLVCVRACVSFPQGCVMCSESQNNFTPLESYSSELFVTRAYNTIASVLFFPVFKYRYFFKKIPVLKYCLENNCL
jgi:hypothetical protein